MRDFAIKTQSLWFLSTELGLLLALLTSLHLFDFINLTGVPLDNVLFYSGILFAVGAGMGFGALETSERNLFWKYKFAWLVVVLFGLGLSIYGLALYRDQDPTWTISFVTGLVILLYGLITFYASMTDESREKFWKLWPFYLIAFVLSLITGLLGFSLFFMGDASTEVISGYSWEFFFSLAGLFGAFSYIPIGFCIGSVDSARAKFGKLNILWLLFAVVGLVVYILAAVEILGDIDVLGGLGHREGALLLGLAFQVPGFVLFANSSEREDFFRSLGPIWFLLLMVGLVLAAASALVTSLPISTLALGTGLVVLSASGVYKAVSLDYVPESLTGGPSRRPRTTGASSSNLNLQQSNLNVPSDLSSEEKIFLIDLQKRTNENTIQLLNNASKSNKLSKDHVTQLVGDLVQANRKFESDVESVKAQAKRQSRTSIFEQAIGDQTASSPRPTASSSSASAPRPQVPQSAPPASPPSAPASSPSPQSAPPGPPMPPASSPSPPSTPPGPPMPPGPSTPAAPPSTPPGPPMPPGPSTPSAPPGPPGPSTPSAPPGPPGPPMPPGPSTPAAPPATPSAPASTPPGPPSPGTPTGASGSAPARSTSIAELRGEMLKELRRLRDIFNEDEK